MLNLNFINFVLSIQSLILFVSSVSGTLVGSSLVLFAGLVAGGEPSAIMAILVSY